MTAPTFTSISPVEGHPGGRYLAVIEGTDFQQHPDPPATGETDRVLEASMEVEVDGILATDVKVYSATRLTCIVPGYKGDSSALTTGLDVDVVLRNLGPPEEETTATDAFAYRRTSLARGDDAGSLNRIIRELIMELRRQVIENVAIDTNIDFDDSPGDGLNIVALGTAPGIALFGPRMRENRLYRRADKPETTTGGTEYEKYREHATDDLMFRVALVAKDDFAELVNLMQEFRLFFRRNTELTIDAHPSDSSYGTVDLELWLTSGPEATGQKNKDNLFLARATFELRGVPLDEDNWQRIDWGKIMSDPPDIEVEYEQKE